MPRRNNMDILQHVFSLHFVSPPPSPLAPSNPQPPDNPKPSEPREGISVSDGSNKFHNVVDLPDTPQLSFDSDLMEDSEKDSEMRGPST